MEVIGGGGVCEVEGVASVASHRELPDRSAELHDGKSAKRGTRGKIVVSVPARSELYGFAGSPGEVHA